MRRRVSIVEGSPSPGESRIEQTNVDRPRLAAERLGDADPRLAQGQVERRGLEGPAPVAARDVALRLGREGVDAAHEVAELAERRVAGQVEVGARVLERDVVDGVVGDVLAEPVLAAAPERGSRW